MRTWRIACGAAVLALGMATAAHADEWNKLTYLTFSGPVSMPGITLPAGTYRFELMDPDSSRRVIRVSEKDGSKQYGIFLSISDQKLEPSDDPVVMFRETPSGQPQAVRAWFYPGETYGYEFVYPHDQAMKIAKATHQPVLSMKDNASSTTDEDRIAAMRGAEVGRIDENGQPVSTDAELKESSSQRAAFTTASNQSTSTTTAGSTTTAPGAQPTTAAAQPNTASGQNAAVSASGAAQPTTAPKSTTAPRVSTASPSTAAPSTAGSNATARQSTTGSNHPENRAVGTSGTAGRRSLPRTASSLPLLTLLTFLSLGGTLGVRVARKSIA